MYKAYLKERENKELVESDDGFIVYGYNCVPGIDFPHVYIQDVWVKPERRKTGVAAKLADQVCDEARSKGFRVLLGSVDTSCQTAHVSMLVLINYGMQLFSASQGAVFFAKEL